MNPQKSYIQKAEEVELDPALLIPAPNSLSFCEIIHPSRLIYTY
jgi:hypothetical protein